MNLPVDLDAKTGAVALAVAGGLYYYSQNSAAADANCPEGWSYNPENPTAGVCRAPWEGVTDAPLNTDQWHADLTEAGFNSEEEMTKYTGYKNAYGSAPTSAPTTRAFSRFDLSNGRDA